MSADLSSDPQTVLAPRESMDDLYAQADRLDVTPGWIDRRDPIFWAQPRTSYLPMLWQYDHVRDALDVAGGLIDVELAERRNLVLRNPAPGNNFATARTLVCAYQMILPGEVAPTHRHAPHALRIILDAIGSYSIVDGERIPMETGDVIFTPGEKWHGHGHEGTDPAYWLDGLDIPLVHLLEPMFYEEYPGRYQKIASVATASPYRFARDDIERALDKANPDPEGAHGPRVTLAAPDVPTMNVTVERLVSGVDTRPHRSNANRVFVATTGEGSTTIDGVSYEWSRGDAVVAPTWTTFSHRATSDATLLSISDEPTMRALNYYRGEHQ